MNVREWIGNQSVLPTASTASQSVKRSNNESLNQFEKIFNHKQTHLSRNEQRTEANVLSSKQTTSGNEKEVSKPNQFEPLMKDSLKEKVIKETVENEESLKENLKRNLLEKTKIPEELLADMFLILDLNFDDENDLLLILEQHQFLEELSQIDVLGLENFGDKIAVESNLELLSQVKEAISNAKESKNDSNSSSAEYHFETEMKSEIVNLERFRELVQLNEKFEKIELMKDAPELGDQRPVIENPLLPQGAESHVRFNEEAIDVKTIEKPIQEMIKITKDSDSEAIEPKENISSAYQQMISRQPIGVLDSQQPLPIVKEAIVSQINDMIKGHVKVDDLGTSMLVKLKPEHLGDVELKLSLHRGSVLAEIKVENEIVKAAVESQLDDLRQNLSNKGYSVTQMSVSVDSGKKDQNPFSGSRQGNKGKNTRQLNNKVELFSAEDILNQVKNIYDGTIDYLG